MIKPRKVNRLTRPPSQNRLKGCPTLGQSRSCWVGCEPQRSTGQRQASSEVPAAGSAQPTEREGRGSCPFHKGPYEAWADGASRGPGPDATCLPHRWPAPAPPAPVPGGRAPSQETGPSLLTLGSACCSAWAPCSSLQGLLFPCISARPRAGARPEQPHGRPGTELPFFSPATGTSRDLCVGAKLLKGWAPTVLGSMQPAVEPPGDRELATRQTGHMQRPPPPHGHPLPGCPLRAWHLRLQGLYGLGAPPERREGTEKGKGPSPTWFPGKPPGAGCGWCGLGGWPTCSLRPWPLGSQGHHHARCVPSRLLVLASGGVPASSRALSDTPRQPARPEPAAFTPALRLFQAGGLGFSTWHFLGMPRASAGVPQNVPP